MVAWSKRANGWIGTAGPFAMNVAPKGDGRWNWEVVADGSDDPTATGVAASLGAAKTACEQFVKRSGRV